MTITHVTPDWYRRLHPIDTTRLPEDRDREHVIETLDRLEEAVARMAIAEAAR